MSRSDIKRSDIADLMKGILILCVLFGHSVSMINSIRGRFWYQEPLNVVLTSFEMQGFMLISGFFFANALMRRSILDNIMKRFIQIVPILFFWEVLPCLYNITKGTENISIKFCLSEIYSCIFSGKLWYISSYLVCSSVMCCIVGLIKTLSKTEQMQKWLKILIMCILILLVHVSRFSFANSTYLILFFITGILVNEKKNLSERFRILIIVLAIGYFILIPFYTADVSFYMLSQYIETFSLDIFKVILIYIYRYILGVCGVAVVYLCCVFLKNKVQDDNVLIGFIKDMGKRSLAVYILSMYIQEAMLIVLARFDILKYLNDYSVLLLFAPLFFMVLIYICNLADNFISKNKFVHKLLLG